MPNGLADQRQAEGLSGCTGLLHVCFVFRICQLGKLFVLSPPRNVFDGKKLANESDGENKTKGRDFESDSNEEQRNSLVYQ